MNLREFVIGFAVFILTLFVAIYGVNTFIYEPNYNDFCSYPLGGYEIDNEASCLEAQGVWVSIEIQCIKAPCSQGYCDLEFNCRGDYEKSLENYNMSLFLITVPLGILIILAGVYLFNLESVGVGIMAGGVGTILRGALSYWRYSEDWLRFLISFIGLVILIYFSYKFQEKISSKGKQSEKRKK